MIPNKNFTASEFNTDDRHVATYRRHTYFDVLTPKRDQGAKKSRTNKVIVSDWRSRIVTSPFRLLSIFDTSRGRASILFVSFRNADTTETCGVCCDLAVRTLLAWSLFYGVRRRRKLNKHEKNTRRNESSKKFVV